jgi:predicted membrane-bound spermidine synthase
MKKSQKRPVRFVPHAVVFVTSMGVMIVELVASRLVSKYLGSSLFTWTGVIGIVLGGISLGNWLGGRLADRFAPRNLAAILLLVSSLLTFLIIALDVIVGRMTWALGTDGMTVSGLARTLALIAVLFLLPSTALGTVSPVMAKYALQLAAGVGKTVGGIYAVGSLGSIGGTFLAGFFLIPTLGLTMNILLVGIILALLSLLMGGRWFVSGGWAAVLVLLAVTGAPDAAARTLESPTSTRKIVYAADSPYSYIRVTDEAAADGLQRSLRLDALIHNKTDPAQPDALLYEYERIFEAATRAQIGSDVGAVDTAVGDGSAAGPQVFSTLTLGGGGFTFPLYLERHYPAAHHTVVEIDPKVVQVARAYFGLPAQTRLQIAIADARVYVERLADSSAGNPAAMQMSSPSFDIVYCDAFNAFSVPAHLTTRQFIAKVAGLLSPGGLFLVNCIDILDSGRFLNAYLNTLKTVFPRVAVYVDPSFTESIRATFVVAAGGKLPAASALRGPDGAAVGIRLSEEKLSALRARNGAMVLTDDFAPVDNLMAPVFLRSVK